METFLLIATILLAAGLIVGLALTAQALREARRALAAMESKLTALQKVQAAQEKQLANLQASLANKPDMVSDLINTAMASRRRGLLPMVAAIGFRLVRSYWGSGIRMKRREVPAVEVGVVRSASDQQVQK